MKMDYIPVGDYCIPNLELLQESRPIGKWGRMHRRYLETYHPIRFNQLVLSGTLWTNLADLNAQAQERMETLIEQMKTAEGILPRSQNDAGDHERIGKSPAAPSGQPDRWVLYYYRHKL